MRGVEIIEEGTEGCEAATTDAFLTMTNEELKALATWALGDDTGRSSEAIARAALTGKPQPDHHMPYDAEDFGRCYRLVKLVPSVREGIRVNAKQGGTWDVLKKMWHPLCLKYEQGDRNAINVALREINRQ